MQSVLLHQHAPDDENHMQDRDEAVSVAAVAVNDVDDGEDDEESIAADLSLTASSGPLPRFAFLIPETTSSLCPCIHEMRQTC